MDIRASVQYFFFKNVYKILIVQIPKTKKRDKL